MSLLIGTVVSAKREKTVAVEVKRSRTHPVYHKIVRRKKKFHVHDDLGAKKGDRVKVEECAPVSKTKKWRVVEIIKKQKS